MYDFVNRFRGIHAVLVGVCVGLLVNLTIVPAVFAASVSGVPASEPISPVPVPVWGLNEYSETSSDVYEHLFPHRTWDQSSKLILGSREPLVGANFGQNNYGDSFHLQVFVKLNIEDSEAAASLSSQDYATWTSSHISVSFVMGLLLTDPSTVVPFIGFVYSSDVNPDATVEIFEKLDSSLVGSLLIYWENARHLQSTSVESDCEVEGDWQINICDFMTNHEGVSGQGCDVIMKDCAYQFKEDMRLVLAGIKVGFIGAGACGGALIVAGVMCVTGNLAACAFGVLWSARCARAMQAVRSFVALGAAAATASYIECIGGCGSSGGCV